MRKAMLALLTFVPLVVGTPHASAARPTWAGRCHFEGGYVSVAMALYEPGNPTRIVGGTVFCYVYPWENGVRGPRIANYGFSGEGVIVGARADYIYVGGDFLVCHYLAYDSGEVDPEHCDGYSTTASLVDDAVDATDPVFDLTAIPDPVLCPILVARSPGIPGVVDIRPDGDVDVAGQPLWDCPPYEV